MYLYRTESNLVILNNSKYLDPVFSFSPSIGITDIHFFNSSKLGERYQNNIVVGDITLGNLYFFKVNSTRTGLDFGRSKSNLRDNVADGDEEFSEITFVTGFKETTDIKTGLDGLLYVLTFDLETKEGKIFRISSLNG
jgi:aldose sugar dehydrogenase